MLSKTRLPLLLAWVVILGVLAYVSTHPRLVAPLISNLVSRNIFREIDASLKVQDFRLRYWHGVDLYNISLTIRGEQGGVTLIGADTLSLDYNFKDLLASPVHVRRLTVKGGEVYAHQGEPQAESTTSAPNWPQIRVDQVDLQKIFLEVSDSHGRLLERVPELNWRGVVRADTALSLESRNAAIVWETRDCTISRMYGRIDVGDGGIRCQGLHAQVGESQVIVNGQRHWNGDFDISIQAQTVTVQTVENLLDTSLGFTAAGNVDIALTARNDTLTYTGTFSGELEGYRLENMYGDAVITLDQIWWHELSGRVNSAYFIGTGQFDIADPERVSFTLAGEVADVNLANDLVPGEELPATDGHGYLTIFHADDPLRTQVTGIMRDGFIADIPFDSCRINVVADDTSLALNGIDLFHSDQHVFLTGQTDSARIFSGYLTVEVAECANLPAGWALPPCQGRLVGEGTLDGPENDLTFRGRASLSEFELAPLAAQTGHAQLTVRDVLGEPWVAMELRGDRLEAGGVPLGKYAVQGSASARGAEVRSFYAQHGDTVVSFQGAATFSDSLVAFRVADFRVELEGNEWRLAEPATFSTGEGSLELAGFHLASEHGALTLHGFRRRPESLAGALQLRNFNLGLLNPFLTGETVLSGEATATIDLAGSPADPVVSIDGNLTGCELELARIDSLLLTARYQQRDLTIERLDLLSNHGRLRSRGHLIHTADTWRDFWPSASLDLELDLTEADWAFVDQFQIPALDRIAGRFDAALQVSGTTQEPVIQGGVVSRPFNVHWLHLEELTGQLRIDSEQLVLSDLVGRQGGLTAAGRIEMPLAFDLLSEPITPEESPFLMHLVIPPESDLAALSRACNAFLRFSGTGGAEVTVAGPLKHPLFQGRVTIRDAGFVIIRQEEIYRNVSVDGVWSGDVLTLNNIAGEEGARGTFHGDGTLTFNGLELETFDIRLAADRFLVASVPDLRVLVRTDAANLTGVKVGPDSLIVPRFTGQLEVIEARYLGDFAEQPGAAGPIVGTVAPDWLADIHVIGPPRTSRILNRAMELYMSGDVDLIRDLDGLYLRGTLDIDAGRLPVFNNDFKVVQGRLDFSQEVGLVPRVDLNAETIVRVRHPLGGSNLERIDVHVTGTLQHPELSFSSESGYAREGIERLLLGMSPHQGGPQASSGLTGVSIAAGFNLLEREIAASLNIIDTFDIDQIERDNENGTNYVPLIGVGKYVSQELYVKYAQGLSDQADRDLVVEYQINNYLLLQSEIRQRFDEWQGDPTYSLDLKYRFEY
ncbi:MAG: translocation/assembly module TamB domain-containing protein [bacterium]